MIQILADIGSMLDSPLMQRAVIIAVLVAFGVVHYKSLTPAQLAEEKAHSAAK